MGVLATVVGLPQVRHRSGSGKWYTALLRFGVNLIGDPDVTAAGFAARDELDSYLRPLVAERRRFPGPGLLSMLAHAEVEAQQLTDERDRPLRNADDLCGRRDGGKDAGHVRAQSGWASGATLSALQADRTLLDRALAESLRYTAPTHMIPRKTRAELLRSAVEPFRPRPR